MFFCRCGKGLLNFVSERINLVFRINNTRLAFQTSKTTIYRAQTSELKSISKFKLLFHWKNFEKLIYYLLYSTLKQLKNTLIAMIHAVTRVFHQPLTVNIFNQKQIFATYAYTKEHFMSLLRAFR